MDEWKKKRVAGSKGLGLVVKLKAVKSVLKKWQREVRLEDYSLEKLESRLKVIEARAKVSGWNPNLRDERRKVLADMWSALLKEKRNWRQKARVKWIPEGDRNSNFFHLVCNARRRRNFFDKIYIDGALCVGPSQVRVGKGMRASFWRDLKVAGIPLAEAFSRIHALAAKKIGVVNEFGAWNGTMWQWNIVNMMPIFGYEYEVWFNFINEVEKFKMRRSIPDSLIWTPTSSGQVSVSSFQREIEARMANVTHFLEMACVEWGGAS
ncbi:hypothetical protein Dsin_015117 [Dipteronia sinensis]|uniref:Uncharacterized protein n=1 Tax=Dipteronia sinensis TaxID=43782 RepID=A0AAE0ANG7_9ROSI|nr:hypothetical protein Dsin_015117 [Dipteronia sinensis]